MVDAVALATLKAETLEDLRVVVEAAALARSRLGLGGDAELEATAYQLARLYACIEQLGVRVARAFENHIDERAGWHAELIRRMSLDIPGVRPPLFPRDLVAVLHDLRGFRHMIHHAYAVKLDAARVASVVEHAEQCAAILPNAVRDFFAALGAP